MRLAFFRSSTALNSIESRVLRASFAVDPRGVDAAPPDAAVFAFLSSVIHPTSPLSNRISFGCFETCSTRREP